jgi:hypothetical protein
MDKEVDFKDRPGSALASLIPDWAVSIKGGCSCKDWEKKMNKWGPDACGTTQREGIVNHLMAQDEQLIPPLRALPAFAKRLAANKLLDAAIRKSVKD